MLHCITELCYLTVFKTEVRKSALAAGSGASYHFELMVKMTEEVAAKGEQDT